jgi:hypothetical protein
VAVLACLFMANKVPLRKGLGAGGAAVAFAETKSDYTVFLHFLSRRTACFVKQLFTQAGNFFLLAPSAPRSRCD